MSIATNGTVRTLILFRHQLLLVSVVWCLCALSHSVLFVPQLLLVQPPSPSLANEGAGLLRWKNQSNLNSFTNNQSPRERWGSQEINGTTFSYYENVAVIDGVHVEYRLHPKHVSTSLQNKIHLVAGVLSSPDSLERRQSIRSTWGSTHASNSRRPVTSPVLFLVGGPWRKEIQGEFVKYQDLVWINRTEHYRAITWKVATFYFVAYRHFPGFYALKVDDDSYVRLDHINRHVILPQENVSEKKINAAVDYWGLCNTQSKPVHRGKWAVTLKDFPEQRFPWYGQGGGYLMSPRLLACLVRVSPIAPIIAVEDSYTGILARTCRVPCHHSRKVSEENPNLLRRNVRLRGLFILHHVSSETAQNMTTVHERIGKPG